MNKEVGIYRGLKWYHVFAILTLLFGLNSDCYYEVTSREETIEIQTKRSYLSGRIFLYRKALLPEKPDFLRLSKKEIIASLYWHDLITVPQKSFIKKRNCIKHKEHKNYATLFFDHLKLYS